MLNLDLENTSQILTAGVIPGIGIEEYHKSQGISKSQLDQLAKSPAHYLASLTTPRKETPAMRIGSLLHGLVLEPERVKIAVAPVCDKRTTAGKAMWADFVAENEGAEVVTAEEGEMLRGMAASVQAHPAASALLSGPGIVEGSAWWYDRASGEVCRCRPDKYRDDIGIIVDLKSTEDASPEGFARSTWKYGYHRQAAFYTDGIQAATGNTIQGFAFIAVEKSPPYAVGVYILDLQGEEAGRVSYRNLLLKLADCKINRNFPAYSSKIETLSLPAYAVKEIFNEYE